MGVGLNNLKPGFLEQNPGVRLFLNTGWVFMVDDMKQHLIDQRNDDYHLINNPTAEVANSPIGGSYHWFLRNERRDDNINVSLFDWPIWRGMSWSFGYYKGLFLGLNMELFKSKFLQLNAVAKTTMAYSATSRVKPAIYAGGLDTRLYLFKTPLYIGYSIYAHKNANSNLGVYIYPALTFGIR